VSDHHADLLDIEKLRSVVEEIRPDIIFHCAAHGGYPFQRDSDHIIHTNFRGTLNLLDALRDIDFQCLVHTGSSSEYGHKSHPMSEDDLLEPLSVYGVSKAASTLLCRAVARTQQRPIVTLRLFSVYGHFEEPSRLIPYTIDTCLRGVNPELTDGTPVRDFVFVEDVVDLCVMAGLHRPVYPEIFNVGSGIQRTVREVVDTIIALTGSRVTARWGALSRRPFEPTTWVAEVSRAKQVFGWSPRYDLAAGLGSTIDWQRERLCVTHNQLDT
jgi:nucleoside-diphosphate-sugar epimerase